MNRKTSQLDFSKLTKDDIFKEVDEVTKLKRKRLKNRWLIYNTFLALLAIAVVILLVNDATGNINIFIAPYYQIDIAILVLFTMDYIIRFIRAADKKFYFTNNIFVLISVLPILLIGNDSGILAECFIALQVLCVVHIFKLIKYIVIVAFFKNKELAVSKLIRTNGFIYILYLTFALILTCAIAMSIAEGYSLWDSIWLSFVTSATVGYGDIIPMTIAGRIIAIILMLAGVGLISTLTSTLITYFSNRPQLKDKKLKKQALILAREANSLSEAQIELLTGLAKTMNEDKANIDIKITTGKKQ